MFPPVASIATLTLNPCLDVSYEFPGLVRDEKVRADHTRFDPGGNGINVGRALKQLGAPATNCCILAGEIGELVAQLVGDQLDNLVAARMPGETRINCTILETNPRAQYEVDGIGPTVSAEVLDEVTDRFLAANQAGFGVLTGSLPAGVPETVYGDLVERLRQQGTQAIVDTKGPMLASAIEHGPYLIKPNRHELERHCGRPLPKLEAVVEEARKLQRKGVTYVCVSLGGEGAVLVGPENAYHATAPQVQIRSTVGAGDSLVVGLVAAFAQGHDTAAALRLGIACGSGTAKHPGTSLFTRDDVERLEPEVELTPLNS
ncbi:6-phosphofructokinase isozyme 2 [Bremerella volcania]|uniref:6-phosphofructokinase isozyme 2 n=1 Tax=Bremerella volcania TaxID=2527984 RepID=A0A518C5T4_9BACT|nr:1-phosphofructokinase family hexose kinase [Bremerella volcania]QDU74571.1 6-phosphofructokinase isozyme 2 [Bremerella volcania]